MHGWDSTFTILVIKKKKDIKIEFRVPPSLHRSVKHNQLKLMTRVVMVAGSNDRNCSRLQPLTTPKKGHELYPTHQKLSCLRHNGSRHRGARCAAPQRWPAPSSERSSTGKRCGRRAGTRGPKPRGRGPTLTTSASLGRGTVTSP